MYQVCFTKRFHIILKNLANSIGEFFEIEFF